MKKIDGGVIGYLHSMMEDQVVIGRQRCRGTIRGLVLPRAVLQSFGEMSGLDFFCGGKVGYGSGNLEDTVEGAGAEAHLGHGAFHKAAAGFVEGAEFSHLARSHFGVAINATFFEAFDLAGAGGFDTLADGSRRFAAARRCEFFVLHAWYVDVKIDTVHKRARNPLLISCDHCIGAGASPFRVAIVAAGARVLGGD